MVTMLYCTCTGKHIVAVSVNLHFNLMKDLFFFTAGSAGKKYYENTSSSTNVLRLDDVSNKT